MQCYRSIYKKPTLLEKTPTPTLLESSLHFISQSTFGNIKARCQAKTFPPLLPWADLSLFEWFPLLALSCFFPLFWYRCNTETKLTSLLEIYRSCSRQDYGSEGNPWLQSSQLCWASDGHVTPIKTTRNKLFWNQHSNHLQTPWNTSVHSAIFKQSCQLGRHHFSCWEILAKQPSGSVQLEEEVNTSLGCSSPVAIKSHLLLLNSSETHWWNMYTGFAYWCWKRHRSVFSCLKVIFPFFSGSKPLWLLAPSYSSSKHLSQSSVIGFISSLISLP